MVSINLEAQKGSKILCICAVFSRCLARVNLKPCHLCRVGIGGRQKYFSCPALIHALSKSCLGITVVRQCWSNAFLYPFLLRTVAASHQLLSLPHTLNSSAFPSP